MLGQEIDVGGTRVRIDKVKYVFTTEAGAKANLEMMKQCFADPQLGNHVSFDVFDGKGTRFTVSSTADLADPKLAWLKK